MSGSHWVLSRIADRCEDVIAAFDTSKAALGVAADLSRTWRDGTDGYCIRAFRGLTAGEMIVIFREHALYYQESNQKVNVSGVPLRAIPRRPHYEPVADPVAMNWFSGEGPADG